MTFDRSRPAVVASLIVVSLAACSPRNEADASDAERDAIDAVDANATDANDLVDVANDFAMEAAADANLCGASDGAVPIYDVWMPAIPDGGATHVDGGIGPVLGGPGGPNVAFDATSLGTTCAYLHGGPTDRNHHNTVTMLDGYLIMPWAHEASPGGVTVWSFDDPCHPVEIGSSAEPEMRETHVTGFSFINGRWMVTASMHGIMFWDIRDLAHPTMVRDFTLPNVTYYAPDGGSDSYSRVVLSTFWQAPYVYVGGSINGVFIVDAADPANPRLVGQVPSPALGRVGMVQAVGNLLYVMPSELATTAIMDISDPANPRPIPGGQFELNAGIPDAAPFPPRWAYSATVNGGRAFYARHTFGGSLITHDVSDPSHHRFQSEWAPAGQSNGGYVSVQNNTVFVGFSDSDSDPIGRGVALDITDPVHPNLITEFHLHGDLDFVTPIGNVVVLSVDDGAIDGEASAVVPFRADPDRVAPHVNMVSPANAATDQAITSRVGVQFDESVDAQTVNAETFIVRELGSTVPLAGYYSAQEWTVNFWPAQPLRGGTTYEVIVPAHGIRDYSGNGTADTFRSTFTTAPCP